MKFFKKTGLGLLLLLAVTMTSCLNILEEINFKKSGGGHYKMSIDMGQMKQMMDMLKGMGTDSTGSVDQSAEQFNQLGDAFTQMTDVLKGIRGVTNPVAISDTASFVFGYEFDFADIEALNKAVKKINEAGDGSTKMPDEVFKFKKGKFERVDAGGNMVDQITKSMMGGDAGADMEQVKMMFADMTATTIYRFEGQKVSKQSHDLGTISADGQSITIEQKPFAEGADLKKMGSGITAKVK